MAIIKVRGARLDVDIRYELEQFAWTGAKWSVGKLIAASPFRYDNTPSFFVNLDGDYAGTWKDSGAYDAEFESGNFTTLLAFLRNETVDEAEDYLCDNYLTNYYDGVKLNFPNLQIKGNVRYLSNNTLLLFSDGQPSCDYLSRRGISSQVQKEVGAGYDRDRQAIVIPWYAPNGKLANIKFRSIYGKSFWYLNNGVPIRNLVWGSERSKALTVLCEAEIDAMSWETAGYSAIAVGGASFSDMQRDIIIRSGIQELIIATDNDKMGEKLRKEVAKALSGYVRIKHAYIRGAKDANEILVKEGVEALREAVAKAESSKLTLKLR
jgi:5S rRNA maturation endonuclease (ribonuclease M5)